MLEIITRRGKVTRNDIAETMGVGINRVTGRVKELLEQGIIRECGSIKFENRSRSVVEAVPLGPEQGKLAL